MKHPRACHAIAAALTQAAPFAASAQENESPYSWNVTAVSDYLFRGVSQTDEDPTLQAGFTYTSPVGLYAGVWGSGVDFGAGDPKTEVDYLIGYGVDVSERVNFDVLLNRYTYLKSRHQNYNELITTVTWDETVSLTYGFTNDVYALGERGQYFGLGGSWDVGHDIGLDIAVGMSTFDDATGIDNYRDWSVSLNRDFGPVNAAIGYYDTDGEGTNNFGEVADGRVVLTFSIGG